mgnify:CR=1 FL=1
MVKPRQVLYDINHLGFILYILRNFLINNSNYSRSYNSHYSFFQNSFHKITGLKNVIPLSRARLGFYLFINEIITKEKNEVIMSPFTIFDVVNMVICAGGKPVFVDINSKKDLNLNTKSIEAKITERTGCALITHYHHSNTSLLEIRKLCNSNDIKLIEDCAISLGSNVNSRHVGYYSDAAIYSFSIFKFISVYQGGALYIKDKNSRKNIIENLNKYKEFRSFEMIRYFLKALKFSILTNKWVFEFVFKVLRIGFNKNIKIIRDAVKNDPKPFKRFYLPPFFQRKANLFQLKEFHRQLAFVEEYHSIRRKNFMLYDDLLGFYKDWDKDISHSFLNYPLVFKNKNYKKLFISFLFECGFDVGEYYYRSCNTEKVFKAYKSSCANSEHYSNCVVTMPTHYRIDSFYIKELCKNIIKFRKIYKNCLL